MIALVLVLVAAAIAAYKDMKTRRIPNEISAALLVAGLALSVTHGLQTALVNTAVSLAVFLVGTALFSLGLIGGGDVKLAAAAAAVLGWPDTLAFLLYTILAGGLLGIAVAVARGRIRPMLSNLSTMIFPALSGLRPAVVPSAVGSMPYALAIFAGALGLALGNALGFSLRISL